MDVSSAVSDEPPTFTEPDPLDSTSTAPDTATTTSIVPEPCDSTENVDASSPLGAEAMSPDPKLVIEVSASFGTVTVATTEFEPAAGVNP